MPRRIALGARRGDAAWRGHDKEPQRRAGGKAAGSGELVRPNLL
jgi:hypothetical protein